MNCISWCDVPLGPSVVVGAGPVGAGAGPDAGLHMLDQAHHDSHQVQEGEVWHPLQERGGQDDKLVMLIIL